MAPLFPRSGPGERGATTSRSAYPVAYLFRFWAPRDPPCFVSRSLRSRKARGTFLARSLFTRRPNQPVCSHVDVNGISQVPRRSVPCLCLALRPRPNRQSLATHTVSSLLPPRFPRRRLQRLMNFGAQSRGFSTRCLRFANGVATIHARLASGWLARLYRERVELSGSLQKVSDHPPPLLDLAWRKGSFIFEPPSRFTSFDHYVGGYEQLIGHGKAERLGRLEVDDQLELGRLDHWQVGGLLALENATNIDTSLTIVFGEMNAVAD